MYVNKCTKCGAEFETKNPKRVICPNCLYADKKNNTEDAETTVRVMNNTNIENGKAALQSDGHILISEATVQLGKAENVTCYYGWGIWATNGYLTVTDGAQVDMTLRNEADLDPDSDVNAITTGMGSSANPAGTITFSAGESEVLTKVVIRAGRPIRNRVKFVGQEFMEFIPWI